VPDGVRKPSREFSFNRGKMMIALFKNGRFRFWSSTVSGILMCCQPGCRSAAAPPVGGGLPLADRRVKVADPLAFKIDFDVWLRSQSGSKACDVAGRFGLTGGRVSQLRTRFRREWQIFQGEAA
jgi:hypothetical protein